MGKSSNQTAGYRFKLRNHNGLTYGPIDALLEFRGGDKVAWSGRWTASGMIFVNAPKLWGGDKDQGGIVGNLYLMMGEPDQTPNPMLVSTFGNQTGAWRGFATVAFDGLYGSNNPYPQPQSFKVEKILKGWDNDECWYPEKAPVPLVDLVSVTYDQDGWRYFVKNTLDTGDDFSAIDFDDSAWLVGPGGFGSANIPGQTVGTYVPSGVDGRTIWIRRHVSGRGKAILVRVFHDDGCWLWWNGVPVTFTEDDYYHGHVTIPASMVLSDNVVCARVVDSFAAPDFHPAGSATEIFAGLEFTEDPDLQRLGINPAHALYYLRTQSHKGGEPTANIDAASFTAAADRLYAERFGICVRHDPDQESVEDIENRICKLIGGSVNRSPVDGKLHLDLARGDYVLDDLPVVTDDDILDFSELPTTPEGSVNSVSVRYFDPHRKETIITPSVDALGLIDEFGLNHQVIDYPEIPIASLAARIATRELLQFITPSRAFDLVCKPSLYALQPNQYFRLQIPKRGIDDMVCIVGDKQGGTLKSGAVRLQAAQVADTLPEFGSVDIETGVDTNPPTTPTAIADQMAFEAPYINVCTAFSPADLAALQPQAGFLVAAAEDPDSSRDFTLLVDAGAGYVEQGDGDWCPTLVVNEAATLEDPLPVDFTFSGGSLLSEVAVGDIALWGNELCRLDAIDVVAGTLSLGRACADTVPQAHTAGEKLWFYSEGSARDTTEYSDGETVSAKLLTNTFSQQLPIASATPIDVLFDMRQARPYAPGQFKIGGDYYPTSVAAGAMTITWAHRDRVLQADQLVDTEAASVGPEATVRYALRFKRADTDALLVEKLDIEAATASVTLAYSGDVVCELYAISDNGESWQRHEHTFAHPTADATSTITATSYVPGVTIIDGGGA